MTIRTRTTDGPTDIVTLTMNPALDITTSVARVQSAHKLRCGIAGYNAGGGGINVARVASALGGTATAVFAAGGAAGEMITDLLTAELVPYERIPIAGTTRESFTVDEKCTGLQYRFVLPGPTVSDSEQTRCLQHLRSCARGARFVVASGSLPPGVAPDFYQQVADLCVGLGVDFILDTSGAGLAHVTSGVFLLKPSLHELRECFRRELLDECEQLAAAKELIKRGVTQNVLVSMGADGALLVTPQRSQRFPAIPVAPGSGVGAGDALVAATTVGLSQGWTLPRSVLLGMAAGAAMLLTPGTDVCVPSDVQRLYADAAAPVDIDEAVT